RESGRELHVVPKGERPEGAPARGGLRGSQPLSAAGEERGEGVSLEQQSGDLAFDMRVGEALVDARTSRGAVLALTEWLHAVQPDPIELSEGPDRPCRVSRSPVDARAQEAARVVVAREAGGYARRARDASPSRTALRDEI